MTTVAVVDLSPVVVAEKIRGYAVAIVIQSPVIVVENIRGYGIIFTSINFKTGYY